MLSLLRKGALFLFGGGWALICAHIPNRTDSQASKARCAQFRTGDFSCPSGMGQRAEPSEVTALNRAEAGKAACMRVSMYNYFEMHGVTEHFICLLFICY